VSDALRQLVGLGLVLAPLAAIRWNLAGGPARRPTVLAPEAARSRWRLEIYSNQAGVDGVLSAPVDVPFPVKRVRSARAAQADHSPELAWTLPQIELDVEIDDPFSHGSISGLIGVEHRVRFVSGDVAVVDVGRHRLRVRRLRFE
jgi:hypothetical protein